MQSSLDDLVQYTQLFKPVATILQGTVFPFLIIYPVVFYSWIFVYGFEDNFEAGFVTVAVIAVIQILICLCCYWSVHIQCFLACSAVSTVTMLTFFVNGFVGNQNLANHIMSHLIMWFQVKDPLQAEIVKVVPTSNNGFSEIVRLHHTKVLINCIYLDNIGRKLLYRLEVPIILG